mmetsp:Transcript_4176/g.5480  ORF Transcript_4176/g.5480 Transcript_4176/m.5480 type:complete len:371 (-) Transcript_4176:230-1342(-)|eukprot:CAMPEP_0198145526 /NCGR_PEP_ID=MMETSP1443-20131203/24154_1 /TAXON_ID=186043 /ORGANISM="Entomoneis sp., Strain CCMP2396" /LENGTH=370 /DNA_ID=CAMNT_0043809211 /DNA_START=103 /DNA_END=1215 /DNA_ORIENTATION=+
MSNIQQKLLLALTFGSLALRSEAWSFHSSDVVQRQTKAPLAAIREEGILSKQQKIESLSSPSDSTRRRALSLPGLVISIGAFAGIPSPVWATAEDDDANIANVAAIVVQPAGDVKKFFNEGRALESQGNMAAAQRLYSRVVQIEPQFIYGWSNLGNTQTAFGDLPSAEESYTKAINLCTELNRQVDDGIVAQRKCNDLYILLLNRGSLRLNNGMPEQALNDLAKADSLRARPDATVLQNLARAKEVNGLYSSADRDYTTAISMTANEVNPFWLRAAMVKFQIGDAKGGLDLLKRVENRFPQAPEVRAAYAVFLFAKGDQVAGQQKFLEIPDRARLKYVDETYLTKTISWPPAMREELAGITVAVGDAKRK